MFSKFVSPSPAINREKTESVGRAVVVGGVVIKPGEIIMCVPFSPVLLRLPCNLQHYFGLWVVLGDAVWKLASVVLT
jgi:hypothetical protein